MQSVLFDHEWYALQTRARTREAAVEHYLSEGADRGLSPHPLFWPEHFAEGLDGPLPQGENPLVLYLHRPDLQSVSTHPAFDVVAYLEAHPESSAHPGGPLAHYVAQGAPAGLAPNDWYHPDPDVEPHGLVDWMVHRYQEWSTRREASAPQWRRRPHPRAERFREEHPDLEAVQDPASGHPLVSVVARSGQSPDVLATTLEGLSAQTLASWELVLLDESGLPGMVDVARRTVGEAQLKVIQADPTGRAEALNAGLEQAEGEFLAWLHPGDTWVPERLATLVTLARHEEAAGAYDGVVRETANGKLRYADTAVTVEQVTDGWELELARLVLRRTAVEQLHGFDGSLLGHADFDFTLRALLVHDLTWCPLAGVRRDDARRAIADELGPQVVPRLDHESLEAWKNVARNRHLVPWARPGDQRQVAGRTSVLVPATEVWGLTSAAVEAVCTAATADGTDVEVVVVDDGCDAPVSVMLDALAAQWPRVALVRRPGPQGYALSTNHAIARATGELVVILDQDARVRPGWLTPLQDAMTTADTLGAQAVAVAPRGTIRSAGLAFPSCGGVPHELLRDHPVEDAGAAAGLDFAATAADGLMMRFADLVALHGFDPLFRDRLADVDLCLRAGHLRGRGAFRVVPQSRVIHAKRRREQPFSDPVDSAAYLDRWGGNAPRDDAGLWRQVGFEVVGHRVADEGSKDRRLVPPTPTVVRAVERVDEAPPRLRWAIKNPAPNGPGGDRWGDTHFAGQLADALRRLGQEVVTDRRPAFHRATGHLDDVVLVLRGLTRYRPAYGQVNLCWLISHPEMFSRAEASSYDRVYAASTPWASKMARAWGIRIDPLLQATDPTRFQPDSAQPDTGHRVLFVGSSRGQARPIVRQAIDADLPLAVIGPNWRSLIPESYVKAEFLPNDQLGATYRAAGVVLNDHWEDMRSEGFISNRLFDAVAAGARVISDDVAGLGDLFGRSVQVARSAADLARLVSTDDPDSVFGDDDERRRVAAQVAAEHSFDARAAVLLEAALELRPTR